MFINEDTPDIDDLRSEALLYHLEGKRGKIEIRSIKSCLTQRELSLAYTPGVAEPCLKIQKNILDSYKYTARGNMIAVVTDGSAVLGLGDIGPRAALPVMEGKAVLFKRFADIDAFPICLDFVRGKDGKTDIDKISKAVAQIVPSFGGINLEDIAGPACFDVEQKLKNDVMIPVFHDDQHGTAIISQAALINGLEMCHKKPEDIKVVFNGAGAAGIACANLYLKAGVKKENILMCDSKGVIYKGRDNVNKYKEDYAIETDKRTLKEAMIGADVFVGLSKGNAIDKEMVKSMGKDPIIFAMANPTPEIFPEEALEGGAFIIGTGRSDYPNQINNVLGFPGIFRGAMDSRATDVNMEMKLAAAKAIAEIAKEEIPRDVKKILYEAYPEFARTGIFDRKMPLDKEYIIPKCVDTRVVPRVARYVAEAAHKTGIARRKIDDFDAYEKEVTERIKDLDLRFIKQKLGI